MLRTFHGRSLLLCSLLVVGFSGLSWRLVQIQLIDRQRYVKSSKSTFSSRESLSAERGMIVDRNEEVLAKSYPVSTLMVERGWLNDSKLLARSLAIQEASTQPGWADLDPRSRSRLLAGLRGEILERYKDTPEILIEKHLAYAIGVLARPLGMRREELREKIEKGSGQSFSIAKDLPGDIADQLREAIDTSGIEGFRFENSLKRWYTAPNQATHLIGFTGEREVTDPEGRKKLKNIGVFGVEATMEEYLAGRDGWQDHIRDTRGLPLPGESGSLMPPKAGLNVQLTLDMGIQTIVEEEIDDAMKEYQAAKAAIVVMDPKTGGILAMASRPHFDLNKREKIAENGYNFALQAVYEPGSTFKIVCASGAINEGVATPQTPFFCNNGFLQESSFYVKDHHPYGTLTLEGVLQKSSNVGAYKIARSLGTERFYDYVKRFGFGAKTGIQLPGESSGIVRNTGNPVDFSRASYGYSLNVTPLQVASAYCAIANGGKLMQPRILQELVANDGTQVERFDPEVIRAVIKPETAKKMRLALEKVVEKGGTATLAAVPGYRVAGKTGTAKRHNPHGRGYLENRYTVSFAGMMPAEDPAFVAVVVIDDPLTNKVTRYGGTIAAPVFGKMAARIATSMNLQPTEPVEAPLARTQDR